MSEDFAAWLDAWLTERPEDTGLLALSIRLRRPAAESRAFARLDGDAADDAERVALIEALSRTRRPAHLDRYLALLETDHPVRVREAALAALQHYGDDAVATAVIAHYANLPGALQQRGLSMLTSRANWSTRLLDAVEQEALPAAAVAPDLVANLRRLNDPEITARTTAIWGHIRRSPQEMMARMSAVRSVLLHGEGQPDAGRVLFAETCAKCHVLHGDGRAVGPELTGLERDNREYLLQAIIDPSSVVLPEYLGTILTAEAEDEFGVGEQILTGFVVAEDTHSIRMVDSAGNEQEIAAAKVKSRRPMELSIMPEGLLSGMSDAQVRDLFAYLQHDAL